MIAGAAYFVRNVLNDMVLSFNILFINQIVAYRTL
jgi:hypothetical protein